MKVAVIGADGQLGSDVVDAFREKGDDVYSLDHSKVEVASFDSVVEAFDYVKPEITVNTAAMHHVEKCETDPDRAAAVNTLGAENLGRAASRFGSLLIHISTDYVFDGAKHQPYVESDRPMPLNVYGKTKLAGESRIPQVCEKFFILRTSALYGKKACKAKGPNFVELMLQRAREGRKLRVVNDEIVSPTSTAELAMQIVTLSRSKAYGLYHATAEGSCSWYEFAREIFSLANVPASLEIAGSNEFPAKVPRPKYSVLENHGLKTKRLSIFRDWREGLRDYLLT